MTSRQKISIFLGLVLISGFCYSQNTVIDSLKSRLSEVEGEGRIKVMIGLSYHYLRISADSSLIYSNQALDYSIETDNRRGVARGMLMIGSGHNAKGEYSLAIESQLRALEIFEEIKDTAAIGITYNNLATNYHTLGKYSEAINYYQLSTIIAKKQGNSNGIFLTLINIGTIYAEWKKYETSIEHFENACNISLQLKDKNYQGLSLHNIGVSYLKLEQYEKAKYYLEESLKIRNKLNDKEGIFSIYINLGDIYKTIINYDSAISYYTVALQESYVIGNETNEALATLKLGETYLLAGETKKVEPLLKEALNLSIEIGETKYLKETYKALSDYYSQINDFEKAYSNYVEYTAIKDTIFNRDSRREISEMQTLYELDKKENEIEIQNLRIDKQQAQFYYTISGIALLLILAVLLFNRYKMKQKHYRIELEKKNIDIEQRLLRTQMNPHFIFNSLNSINSFITDNNSDSAQAFLSKFARLMRYILENSRKTFVPVEDEVNTLQLNMELEQLRFDNKYDFEIIVDENIDTEFTFIPPMLIQPFIENAILHGLANKPSEGKIYVELKKNGELMHCIIEDNGIGREKAMELKEQSGKSKRQSLGMQVTKERLDILNEKTTEEVTFKIIDKTDSSGNPEGTRVELRIPYEEE